MRLRKLFVGSDELHIEKRIGKGGEGEVFAISNMPGFAVKTYLPGIEAKREKKIRAMVGAHLADNASMVAFPYQVVVDGQGAFAGFVMRLVEKHKEIHELQTPSSRQKHFPKADYAFIVRVALNIARVFAQVHSTGCVVGDINQRGILVSQNAMVALIDADSFQVSDGAQRYLCVVGVPEYTPPELQGKSLKTIVRTIDHDAFGLAVCLFQLLCMDRHPFSGRYIGQGEMPLEKAIADYRFAYSSRKTDMMPPPGTVRLDDFTPKVAQLFETAFSPNYVGQRPSAQAWIDALGDLESALRTCSRNKLHRYAQNAKECPWCRMESEYGRPLFLDVDLVNVHVPSGRLDPAAGFVLNIPALLSSINGVAIPSSISVAIPQVGGRPTPSQAARNALSQMRWRPVSKIAGVGALVGAAYAFASGVQGIVDLSIAAFGGWLLFRSTSPLDALLSEHQRITSALTSRLEQIQRSSPIERMLRKKAETLDAVDEFQKLALNFGNLRNEYEKRRRQKQLDDHLSQFFIREARIPKVSSGDIAQLASYGVTTASDAKRRNVQQVHGIGPVKASNIAAWLRRMEANFQFQSAYTQEDQRYIQKEQNDIIVKQQGIEERIKTLVGEFRQEAQGFAIWQSRQDPELTQLAQQLVQAEQDLSHLGSSVPARPNVAPFLVPSVSAFRRVAWPSKASAQYITKARPVPLSAPLHTVSCPQCGSAMVKRTARRGSRAGRLFWGCSRYPSCNGTRPI
ncbi:topoisomerase [Acetobacter orientalis]|uniref:Topoisomerase n=1 Tax=Acetobacter orientalis TaxID=146474 RepID=A0A2Z5ZM33_9PROT|nr:topoisomerase [Acetobacter orientalis]